MSLLSTLAKAAVGMMVAKKVSGALGGGKAKRGGGLNDILGQLQKGQQSNQSGGGLSDILGQITKGQSQSNSQGGGLGGILGQLAKGQQNQQAQPHTQAQAPGGLGGLEGILGGLLGGKASGGQAGGGLGGLGGLLDKLAPKAAAPSAQTNNHHNECSAGAATTGAGGLGDLFNQAVNGFGEPKVQPTPQQDAAAGVLLSAMLQAAKSDGQIDATEQEALMKNLGDVSPEEMNFINQQLAAPVDPQGLASQVPNGMQQQAYMMSVLAIDLDTESEAKYLHTFATALGLSSDVVNAIHQQLGEPALYST